MGQLLKSLACVSLGGVYSPMLAVVSLHLFSMFIQHPSCMEGLMCSNAVFDGLALA